MKVRNSSVLLLIPIFFTAGYVLIFGLVGVADQVENLFSSMEKNTLIKNNAAALEAYVAERDKNFKEISEVVINGYGPTMSEISLIKGSLENGSIKPIDVKVFSAQFHVNPEVCNGIISSAGKQ